MSLWVIEIREGDEWRVYSDAIGELYTFSERHHANTALGVLRREIASVAALPLRVTEYVPKEDFSVGDKEVRGDYFQTQGFKPPREEYAVAWCSPNDSATWKVEAR